MLIRFEYPRISSDVIESLFGPESVMGSFRGPAMDVTESEQEFVVFFELPGVKKDDVKVTFEKGVLTIEGVRKQNEMPKDAKILLNEVRARNFCRSFKLAAGVDANNISAGLENGILRVTLPKSEEAKPKQIEVKVK